MVKPRAFTACEWRDLARGCRALVKLDEEALQRHRSSSMESSFERTKKLHEEMAELCEHWANVKDRKSAG